MWSGSTLSSAYLRARLGAVEALVAALIERRTEGGAVPGALGLSLGEVRAELFEVAGRPFLDDEATALLEKLEDAVDEAEADGEVIALRQLARACRLDAADVDLLLVAAAPDLDARFTRLYGFLHDDLTRGRASVGLALELAGMASWTAEGRARLQAGGPLVDTGVLAVLDDERPFPTRALRVADRVVAHLLGDDRLDQDLAPAAIDDVVADPSGTKRLTRILQAKVSSAYVHDPAGRTGLGFAVGAVVSADLQPMCLDLARARGHTDDWVRRAVLEARLKEAVLVLGPLEAAGDQARVVAEVVLGSQWPVVLYGAVAWDPLWTPAIPFVTSTDHARRRSDVELWEAHLEGLDLDSAGVAVATSMFRLGAAAQARALDAGRLEALADGSPLEAAHLVAGAKLQSTVGLDRLTTRVRPSVTSADLVVPASTRTLLDQILARATHGSQVLDSWGLGPTVARRRGITCLFVGPPGTGKTFAAEVIAGELGVDLYVVNLATMVDKYIGETEKNLERLFSEAESANGMLFFDEADALFGKRSEVRDARDRYANVEVSYLLQRVERFDGIAVLTTNLRTNVDEAFVRRIDLVVDFQSPDADLRHELWKTMLGHRVPLADDVDLERLADSFDLSGGHIRNTIMTAAYLAAVDDGRVRMAHLLEAVRQEYRKLGRLVDGGEFDVLEDEEA